VKNPRRRRK